MNPFPSSSPASALFNEIRREAGPLGLVAGRPGPSAAADRLSRTPDEAILGGPPADPVMAAAVRAGLLLLADRMDESHEISQGISTPEGSWWHGIIHRREPDYDNARYWFRRVGRHPLTGKLAESAPGSGSALDRVCPGRSRWDPGAFIDLCEEARGARSPLLEPLEVLQEHEVCALLAHCYREATGQPAI